MAKRRTHKSRLVDTVAGMITQQNRRAYEEDMHVDLSTEDKVHMHAVNKVYFYADDHDIINLMENCCPSMSDVEYAYYSEMRQNLSSKNRFLKDVKRRANWLSVYGTFWLVTLDMKAAEIARLNPVHQYPDVGLPDDYFGSRLTEAQAIAYKERFGYVKSNE